VLLKLLFSGPIDVGASLEDLKLVLLLLLLVFVLSAVVAMGSAARSSARMSSKSSPEGAVATATFLPLPFWFFGLLW
jgi:hypothetical protein